MQLQNTSGSVPRVPVLSPLQPAGVIDFTADAQPEGSRTATITERCRALLCLRQPYAPLDIEAGPNNAASSSRCPRIQAACQQACAMTQKTVIVGAGAMAAGVLYSAAMGVFNTVGATLLFDHHFQTHLSWFHDFHYKADQSFSDGAVGGAVVLSAGFATFASVATLIGVMKLANAAANRRPLSEVASAANRQLLRTSAQYALVATTVVALYYAAHLGLKLRTGENYIHASSSVEPNEPADDDRNIWGHHHHLHDHYITRHSLEFVPALGAVIVFAVGAIIVAFVAEQRS